MPIAIKRNVITKEDIEGNVYNLPVYYTYVFKKEICILLFYLSQGIKFALDYLHVSNVIKFIDKQPEANDDKLYFQISSKLWLAVNKELFNDRAYIRSIVGAFLTVCTNRTTIDNIDDTKTWIKKIANPPNYEKGLSILKFVNRLMDETTKHVLKLPEYHIEDIYALLRWMMEHFQDLRMKDNMDLANKRIRCNEYIASLLTKEFSRRLNRVITMGDKATIVNIKELFKFPGDRNMSPNLSNCGNELLVINY